MWSSSEEKVAGLTPVYLNVYDLTPVNDYLYWFGIGIFHSGIEGKSYVLFIYLFIPSLLWVFFFY